MHWIWKWLASKSCVFMQLFVLFHFRAHFLSLSVALCLPLSHFGGCASIFSDALWLAISLCIVAFKQIHAHHNHHRHRQMQFAYNSISYSSSFCILFYALKSVASSPTSHSAIKLARAGKKTSLVFLVFFYFILLVTLFLLVLLLSLVHFLYFVTVGYLVLKHI